MRTIGAKSTVNIIVATLGQGLSSDAANNLTTTRFSGIVIYEVMSLDGADKDTLFYCCPLYGLHSLGQFFFSGRKRIQVKEDFQRKSQLGDGEKSLCFGFVD